jgi:hypothetical protein
MSVLLYAIVGSGHPPVTGEGLENGSLRMAAVDGLTAVVSDLPCRPEATEQTLWAYDRALEQLMAAEAVLPARFGTTFAADDEVRTMLTSRHDELSRALESVRGAVELGVRANWAALLDDRPPTGQSAGTEYMLRRLELARTARGIAGRMDAQLRQLARDSKARVLARPAIPVTGSYLVDRSRIGPFRERVLELNDAIAEAELVCTGPWPPYSFVGGGSR